MLTPLGLVFGVLIPVLVGLTALVLLRLPRCAIYVYRRSATGDIPCQVGIVRRDGGLLDLRRPLGRRLVGSVFVRDGKAWVRAVPAADEARGPVDVGCVDPNGCVFDADGSPVAMIDVEGVPISLLGFRRAADVPPGDDEPVGRVVETGRRRAARPGELTHLARGGAALLLHFRHSSAADEVPLVPPQAVWDTGLPAALLFAILWKSTGLPGFLAAHPLVAMPVLGPLLSALAAFAVLWGGLHLLKIFLLTGGHRVLTYLELVNRQTGILRWTFAPATLCAILLVLGLFKASLRADAALYLVLLIGLLASSRATAAPWPVEGRRPLRPPERPPSETPEGDVERDYRWTLDSPFRPESFHTTLRFDTTTLDEIRKENPFANPSGPGDVHAAGEKLVREGELEAQVTALGAHLAERSEQLGLSRFEEIQAALDFVQAPNIDYALDQDCEEIGKIGDYWRWPVETLFDKRGDCDCHAVLAAALMRSLGHRVLLLVSKEAAHAAIAVAGAPPPIPGERAFVEWKGENYYFCETTGDGWRVGDRTDASATMLAEKEGIIDLGDPPQRPTAP